MSILPNTTSRKSTRKKIQNTDPAAGLPTAFSLSKKKNGICLLYSTCQICALVPPYLCILYFQYLHPAIPEIFLPHKNPAVFSSMEETAGDFLAAVCNLFSYSLIPGRDGLLLLAGGFYARESAGWPIRTGFLPSGQTSTERYR